MGGWDQRTGQTNLEERVLLLMLELVGTEELETTDGLGLGKPLFGALEELEDVLEDDSLEVDLFLIVQVFGLQLDLKREGVSVAIFRRGTYDVGRGTDLSHVNFGV